MNMTLEQVRDEIRKLSSAIGMPSDKRRTRADEVRWSDKLFYLADAIDAHLARQHHLPRTGVDGNCPICKAPVKIWEDFNDGRGSEYEYDPPLARQSDGVSEEDVERVDSQEKAEPVAWPNRLANIPAGDGSGDRIVGFRISDGDPILGEYGLSEPLAWLRKVTIDRELYTAPAAERVRVPDDAEAVSSCLGDDAASMLEANPDDERALNMQRAAQIIDAMQEVGSEAANNHD